MRLLNNTLFFFIFLILGLYIVSQTTYCSANDPFISRQTRRSLRTLEDLNPDFKKVDRNGRRSTKQANLKTKAYDAISNEDAEMVYNIDYQGVKTHPSPTPKHP